MKEVLLVSDDHKSKESVKQLGQVCPNIFLMIDKLLCVTGYSLDSKYRC